MGVSWLSAFNPILHALNNNWTLPFQILLSRRLIYD